MRRLLTMGGCGLIIVLALVMVMNAGERQRAVRYTGPQAPLAIGDEGGRDYCQLTGYNGIAAHYIIDYITDDQTVQYIDPVDCGATTTYPFEITSLDFSLWDDGGAMSYPVLVDVVVYDMATPGNPCAGPGTELCRTTAVCTQAAFNYPSVGTVSVSGPCCVNGSFFIGIEYSDPGAGPFPSLLFDNNPAPDTCDLWFYNWAGGSIWTEWYDTHGSEMIGYPSMWVNGETNSTNCDIDDFYTIPEVYENFAALEGQEIKVFGQYTTPEAGDFVTLYAAYILDGLMPLNNVMKLSGTLPDPIYWYGGTMIAKGVVTSEPNPYPSYGPDTLIVTITANSYEYLVDGEEIPPPAKDSVTGPVEQYDWFERDEDCDSCKFAILVSSGGTLGCNKPTYWENIVKLYNYKKDSLDYCPHNIFVHFHNGTSDNPAQIPSNQVRPCTQAAIDASHDTIAQRIAACEADSTKSTVQKMFTNHGADGDGVVLLGAERLSPEELRQMQQKLIDACCSLLYDEFITCYGGDMVDGLDSLDDKGKTEIHANSAAPNDAPGTSPRTGGHPYLNAKIAALMAGKSYEEAVRAAEEAYLKWLEDHVIPWRLRSIAREEAKRDSLPEGRRRTQITNQINWKKDVLAKQRRQVDTTGCPSWVRYQFKEYCEWKDVVVAPGGQIRIKFKGSGGCANITIWEKQADGTWKRVVIWNWNLPGSFGYEAGNDERVINADSTSTGIFRIHNDNGAFTVTVYSYNNRAYPETPSNALTYAGFSLGGTDGGGTEFGYHPGIVTTPNTDQIGFNLEDSPGWFDFWEGTQSYMAQFSAGGNSYWEDMELYINVADVWVPGTLQVLCPAATGGITSLYVDSVGEYTLALGSIEGPAEITFEVGEGEEGPSFIWDCWGLRSTLPTYPETYCMGEIRGNVDYDPGDNIDIADLVFLVDYMFNQGPAPPCFEEADVDGSGGIDISDLVYLVDYMFTGGPPPVPCP